MAERRVPYPPAALSPVSPEVARAVAAAFSGRAWLASALCLLPVLVAAALFEGAIGRIQSEGRRGVLMNGVLLLQLIAAAGTVAVQARRARERVENSEPPPWLLRAAWRDSFILCASLCAGFLVVWVALRGALDSLGGYTSSNLLRIVPLTLAGAMAVAVAALAGLVAWLSAIRAVEGCASAPAVSLLRGAWKASRGRLILHAAVAGLATGAVWLATEWIVRAVYSAAGPPGDPGSWTYILYERALRDWLIWTPTLATLGSGAVASYLLLRPLGQPPPG